MTFQPPAKDRGTGFVPPAKDRGEQPPIVAQDATNETDSFSDITETAARGLVRGIPVVGPSMERGIERIEALFSDRTLPEIEQRGRQLQEERPTLSGASELTGSVAGSVGMVAAAPGLFGAGGGTLFARSVMGAASGGAVGAADTAVRGGDPTTGAAVGAVAGGGAGVAIGGLLGRAFARRSATPTSKALKEQAGPLFDKARDAGVVVKGDRFDGVVTRLATTLEKEGLDPVLHPKAVRALVRLQEVARSGSVDLQKLTTERLVAGTAAGSNDAAERRLGQLMIDRLDGFLSRLTPDDVLAGNPEAAIQTLKEARQLWTRARRAEVIELALERADFLIGTGQDRGVALRGQFRQIANNKKTMRKFTKAQQKLIKEVAIGSRVGEAFEKIGRIRDAVIGGGLVGVAVNPGAGMAVAAGQVGLRFLGRSMRARAAERGTEAARQFAATGSLPPMTPSARARAFGTGALLGAGLEVGRPDLAAGERAVER